MKKIFADIVYNVVVMKKSCKKNKEICLKINGKQSVKLRSEKSFKNHSKQLAVSIKIYADSECVLKIIENNGKNNNTSCTKKYQARIHYSFAYTVVCIDDKFIKKVVLIKGKNSMNKFIEVIFKRI